MSDFIVALVQSKFGSSFFAVLAITAITVWVAFAVALFAMFTAIAVVFAPTRREGV